MTPLDQKSFHQSIANLKVMLDMLHNTVYIVEITLYSSLIPVFHILKERPIRHVSRLDPQLSPCLK